MINFRYHIVSLTAVFFALAIGLVVGTAALNGPAADSLRGQVTSLGQQNQELRDRINHLNDDVNAREQFAEELAPVVLAGKLSGRNALIVSTISGREYVTGVADMLTVAGATLTGRIEIADKFTDPTRGPELLDLAHTSLPPALTGTLPTNSDGAESAGALLATVLHKRIPEVPEADRRKVLAAFANRGFLAGANSVTLAADVIVVVSGPPATGNDAAARNTSVVTLVRQLGRTGALVVAASADAGDGNVVAQVRRDPQLSAEISTVDNVGTPQGRLVTAWAAADEIAARSGHYGIGSGAALLPKTTQ
ncbi:MAG TPA: copper transporter [Micromonosporaceae bacterium]